METTPDLVTVLAAVRALHTGAVLLLFGALVFGTFVDDVPASAHVDAATPALSGKRFLLTSWLAVAVSGVAWLGVEAVAMSGGPWSSAFDAPTLAAVLGSTLFGHAWLVRGALLVAFGALASWGTTAEPRIARALVACSGALLASLAWAGHANAQSGLDGAVHHVADAAHLLAAGAWVGGLPFFAARLRAATAASTPALTARCVRRYGDLAAICVGVLVASGAVNAAYALRVPSLLFESAYGRLLLVKLALFGVMLGIAAVNRWRLTPRLAAEDPTAALAAERLRRLAWLELLLGVGVVVLASALATSAPPMRM